MYPTYVSNVNITKTLNHPAMLPRAVIRHSYETAPQNIYCNLLCNKGSISSLTNGGR